MTHENPTASDNIHIRVFDAADAPDAEAAAEADPIGEYHTHNATRRQYHESIIDALGGASVDLEVDSLALGDDDRDTGEIAAGDVLGNETFRTDVTDPITSGQTFRASTFLDSTEGNDQTFREAALVAETASGDVGINRVVIDDPGGLLDPKSASETVTIDIDIKQEDG